MFIIIKQLPPGRLLPGTFFHWGGADEATRGETRRRGGREGWHKSKRTNETMRELSGEVMACDQNGTRGGIPVRTLAI